MKWGSIAIYFRHRLGHFHRSYFKLDIQPRTHGAEDGGKVAHAGVAVLRQHAMQALAGFVGHLRQLLEAYRRVDEVAQDQAGCFRFFAQKQGCCFVENF